MNLYLYDRFCNDFFFFEHDNIQIKLIVLCFMYITVRAGVVGKRAWTSMKNEFALVSHHYTALEAMRKVLNSEVHYKNNHNCARV